MRDAGSCANRYIFFRKVSFITLFLNRYSRLLNLSILSCDITDCFPGETEYASLYESAGKFRTVPIPGIFVIFFNHGICIFSLAPGMVWHQGFLLPHPDNRVGRIHRPAAGFNDLLSPVLPSCLPVRSAVIAGGVEGIPAAEPDRCLY